MVIQGDGDSNRALDIARGGTNATNAAQARINLGVGELATDAECVAGEGSGKAVTPSGLTARLAEPGAIGSTTPSTSKFVSVTLDNTSDAVLSANSSGELLVNGNPISAAVADATDWLTGVGSPLVSSGDNGDYYIDTTTQNVYRKESGAWAFQFCMLGSSGSIGPQGPAGPVGPMGPEGPGGVTAGTYIVSGGSVAWVSGYTYRVGACSYYIGGTLYTSAEASISLDAADANYDRIDVIGLNAAGTLVKITGTAGSDPAKPMVDMGLYCEISWVYVTAGTGTSGVVQTTIYKEGSGEWTVTASGGTIVKDSTNNPRTDTKCIEGSSVAAGTYWTGVAASAFDLGLQQSLVFYIRPKSAWPSSKAIRLSWYNGSTFRGNTITISTGAFGFNSSNLSYHQIVVPVSSFGIPAGTTVDRLRWEITGGGATVGFYLDDVVLQSGVSPAVYSEVVYRGEWASGTSYARNNIVSYDGSTYLALVPSIGQTPDDIGATENYWQMLGITDVNGVPGSSGGTRIVSGATVSWVSGYTFRIGAASYYINSILYNSAEAQITLDAADESNDRIDVIALNTSGALAKITGTAGANPAKPDVDLSSYAEVTFVYVPVSSTDPGITNTDIYTEGSEWTTTGSGASITVDSTNSPRTGTKCIEGTNAPTGIQINAVAAAPFSIINYNKLVFYIRLKAEFPPEKYIQLRWRDSTDGYGAQVAVSHGVYGFNRRIVGAYQQIVVPISAFSLPPGSQPDRLRFVFLGGSTAVGFYIDDVSIQSGDTSVPDILPQYLNPRGEWISTTGYALNDTVTYNFATYYCLAGNSNKQPDINTAYWSVISASAFNPAPATDDTCHGETITGTSGEALSQWDLVYPKNSSGAVKYFKYDANGTDKEMPPIGMVTASAAGADATITILLRGIIKNTGWSMTSNQDEGKLVYADTATAGGITLTRPATTGDEVVIVGRVIEENVVYLNVCPIFIEVP